MHSRIYGLGSSLLFLEVMKDGGSKKVVYVAMSADILHSGHLNIIKEGQKLGEVVVGLLTDKAIVSYKRLPIMKYDQRLEVLKNIKGVEKVIPQNTLDYRPNLHRLKPDYVVHGTDWRTGVQQQTRKQVIDTIKEWGGKLIEPEYSEGISSTILRQRLKPIGVSSVTRLEYLGRLLNSKNTIRAIEAHNGLSALVVENAYVKREDKTDQFDALWVSSLTDSMAKGKPDTELIDRTSRFATINEILEVTTKPIIFDGDTGGHPEHFVHTIRTLERLGVSAIVIEDKTGLKRNSLHDKSADSIQEEANIFAYKIKTGINARNSEQFMIIARIESFILGKGQKDAIKRARIYLDAGASAIMIHSKDKNGADVKAFADVYNTFENKMPLMVVPTSYCMVSEKELSSWGANIVVYANHLLRASYPAMERVAEAILENNRAYEAEALCTPIEEFIKLIPGS